MNMSKEDIPYTIGLMAGTVFGFYLMQSFGLTGLVRTIGSIGVGAVTGFLLSKIWKM